MSLCPEHDCFRPAGTYCAYMACPGQPLRKTSPTLTGDASGQDTGGAGSPQQAGTATLSDRDNT